MKDLTELKAKIEALPEEESIYSEPPELIRIGTAGDLILLSQQHTDLERRLAEMQEMLDAADNVIDHYADAKRWGCSGGPHFHEDVWNAHEHGRAKALKYRKKYPRTEVDNGNG